MMEHEFIFLAGLHRSGTSLVHRIIRDHPNVTGLSETGVPEDEGQHVQSVYPSAKKLGGPGKFAFNPLAYMDESHPLVSEMNAGKILEQWSPYLDLDKKYIVEKSPPNIIRSRFFQALFPNSRFIFILRHPLAISYATQKWSKTSIKNLMEHTLTAYEIFLDDLPFIEHSLVIRYEEFIANPAEESGKLFEFLGLDGVPVQQQVETNINRKYFDKWQADQKDYSKAWIKPFWKALPENIESRLNIFGYSLNEPEKLLPMVIHHKK